LATFVPLSVKAIAAGYGRRGKSGQRRATHPANGGTSSAACINAAAFGRESATENNRFHATAWV